MDLDENQLLWVMKNVIAEYANAHGVKIADDDSILYQLVNANKQRLIKEATIIQLLENSNNSSIKELDLVKRMLDVEKSMQQYLKIIKVKLNIRAMSEKYLKGEIEVVVDENGNIVPA